MQRQKLNTYLYLQAQGALCREDKQPNLSKVRQNVSYPWGMLSVVNKKIMK
jgi:hypothetical protein